MASSVEILMQLDLRCLRKFPVLDQAYSYTAGVRLTAFSDRARWAMAIEQLVFNKMAGPEYRFSIWLYTYGDCISGLPGHRSEDSFFPISENEELPLFEGYMTVRESARTVRIRNQVVHFEPTLEALARRGISPVLPPQVSGPDLLRLLACDYLDSLLATEEERKMRILAPLPQLLQLSEWRHPDILRHEKPSDTNCFRSLAEALSTGDASRYEANEPPNTDWRNWPRGGRL